VSKLHISLLEVYSATLFCLCRLFTILYRIGEDHSVELVHITVNRSSSAGAVIYIHSTTSWLYF